MKQPPIKVTIKDEQGVGDALMKEGYVRDRVDDAKQLIRKQFEKAVKKVYVDVLGKFVPSIVVSFVSESEKTNGWQMYGRFKWKQSSEFQIFFEVNKPLVVSVLREGVNETLKGVAVHEVIHAADQKMINQSHKLIDTIKIQYKTGSDASNSDALGALCHTIHVFSHFRNEGVALLGEHLLTRTRFGKVVSTLDRFSMLYELTMLKSKSWSQGEKGLGSAYNDDMFDSAYGIAPSIVVLSLAKRGDIEHDLATKLLEGLDTGIYDLNDEEIETVVKQALSLNLSDYIQGVINLGDKIAPVQSFLEFCGLVQKEWEKDDIFAFSYLLNHRKTAELFNDVMKQIMDSTSSEAELDECYRTYDDKLYGESPHLHLKEKVDRLYTVLKNDGDPEKKRIAQLALTYLFNERDLIYDDIKGVGLVDDVTVIDYALKIL